MPRPSRLEYPGALYHVTARGVQQGAIFMDDHDRQALLKYLPNLSTLMQRINSGFCQAVNRRHARSRHLLEGRFKAIVVDCDNYLLEVCRYVDLNPVRAGLVGSPSQWRWSSYASHIGRAPVPSWLATEELQGALTGRSVETDVQRDAARRGYAEWVAAGRGVRLWKDALRDGLHLGDEAFASRMRREGSATGFKGENVSGDRGQA